MKFKYETAIVTFGQFIVLSLLGIANGVNSVATTCHREGSDCLSNAIVSLIFLLLTVAWFGFIWVLGYAAQERRSRRLAQLLIGAELLVVMVAYFNARHHPDFLSLVTSIADLILAVWVIILAWRLMRAGGGRIVAKQRPRRRQRPTAPQ